MAAQPGHLHHLLALLDPLLGCPLPGEAEEDAALKPFGKPAGAKAICATPSPNPVQLFGLGGSSPKEPVPSMALSAK